VLLKSNEGVGLVAYSGRLRRLSAFLNCPCSVSSELLYVAHPVAFFTAGRSIRAPIRSEVSKPSEEGPFPSSPDSMHTGRRIRLRITFVREVCSNVLPGLSPTCSNFESRLEPSVTERDNTMR
jgi:hypothetical protein